MYFFAKEQQTPEQTLALTHHHGVGPSLEGGVAGCPPHGFSLTRAPQMQRAASLALQLSRSEAALVPHIARHQI